MAEPLTQEVLEAAHCWEPDDRVPGSPEMTELRRRLRLHQAGWREANGHPVGTQPIVPRAGKPVRPVGSRLPLDYARETGAGFLTPASLVAVRERVAVTERHQNVDLQRLWADLLWSPALAFNLFGDVAADGTLQRWMRDAPGRVGDVRFQHSPGRLDLAYIGSLVAFDVAFVLDLGDGTSGVLAVDVKYHERATRHEPKPSRLNRYREVAARSNAFRRGAVDELDPTLVVMWLEHLLVLSMLQHESGTWAWGRYVVVHPAANTDVGSACERYRSLLKDESTFASATIEDVVDSGALVRATAAAVRGRYLPA